MARLLPMICHTTEPPMNGMSRKERAMRRARLWIGVALLFSTGLGLSGCGDSPTSIEPEQEIEALPVRGPAYAHVQGVVMNSIPVPAIGSPNILTAIS